MPRRSSSSCGVVFLDRAAAIRRLRAAVAELRARRPDVVEAWLFGSLARGGATARSDADVLLVVDRDARRPMDRIPEFASLLEAIDRPCDLIVLTRDEWKAREGSAFHREVSSRGLRLDVSA